MAIPLGEDLIANAVDGVSKSAVNIATVRMVHESAISNIPGRR